jgi:hypothetical protein
MKTCFPPVSVEISRTFFYQRTTVGTLHDLSSESGAELRGI